METGGFRKYVVVEASRGGSGGGAGLAPPQNLTGTSGFL